jgi:hypothetical protein
MLFRSSNRRKGSVLILVVVLLVLMALIGTAYLSTARIDRSSAAQSVSNVQFDVMFESAVDLAKGTRITPLYDSSGNFMPLNADSIRDVSPQDDLGLADRVPEIADYTTTATNAGGTNPPYWSTVSWPADATASAGLAVVDFLRSPTQTVYLVSPWTATIQYQPGDIVTYSVNGSSRFYVCVLANTGSAASNSTNYVAPDAANNNAPPNATFWAPCQPKELIRFVPDSYTTPGQQQVPILRPYNLYFYLNGKAPGPVAMIALLTRITTSTGFMPGPRTVVGALPAADTDGDGIADSLLTQMPMDLQDGRTYFAAMRVIDQNSAVNAAVAWKPFENSDKNSDGNPPAPAGNFFPTNVDLQGLLATNPQTTEMGNFNQYFRFCTNQSLNMAVTSTPVDDSSAPHSDFKFQSQYDAFWMQCGRRLDNPGYNTAVGKYLGQSNDAAVSLASGFILGGSSASPYVLGRSFVETKSSATPNTLGGLGATLIDLAPCANPAANQIGAITSPYAAGNVVDWFNQNFNLAQSTPTMYPSDPTHQYSFNRRALMTTRNGVSNLIYEAPLAPGMKNYVQNVPNPKASVNTLRPSTDTLQATDPGGFDNWWRAYYSVMTSSNPLTPGNGSPYGTQPPDSTETYLGSAFNSGTFAPVETPHEYRQFRSPIRDPRTTSLTGTPTTGYVLGPDQVAELRAALAAINHEALLAQDNVNFRARPITLTMQVGNATPQPVTATVFATMRQPFITEVYANTDKVLNTGNGPNPAGYVAVELFNPYPTDMPLKNLMLYAINRGSGLGPNYRLIKPASPLADFNQAAPNGITAANTVIKAYGYALLENFDETGADNSPNGAKHRPAGTQLPVTGVIPNDDGSSRGSDSANQPIPPLVHVYVANLATVLDNELLLVYHDPVSGSEMPYDSFDFSGLTLGNAATAAVWHYVRTTDNWGFVYPGRYDASVAGTPRHQGVSVAAIDVANNDVDPWDGSDDPVAKVTLGTTGVNGAVISSNANTTTAPNSNNSANGASYPKVFPIQWMTNGQPGPFPVQDPNNTATIRKVGNQFPFGAFARNGDVLNVPYIGAYQISDGTGIIEINALSMDASFAEDTDINDDKDLATGTISEQIGRFCPTQDEMQSFAISTPLGSTTVHMPKCRAQFSGWVCSGGAPGANGFNDAARTESAGTWNGWTVTFKSTNAAVNGITRVVTAFDGNGNFTLNSPLPRAATFPGLTAADSTGPHDTYILTYSRYAWAESLFDYLTVQAPHMDYLPDVNPNRYGGGTVSPVRNIATGTNVANSQDEFMAPVEGLININTASWRVLAALPMVVYPNSNGAQRGNVDTMNNTLLARAIVADRLANGPFKSAFELNRVPGFMTAMGTVSANPDQYEGDLVPDPTTGDYKRQYLVLTRISNMITTKSDMFTCYVQVQGWTGIGTNSPSLDISKRAALIVDRTNLNASNRQPRVYTVPVR